MQKLYCYVDETGQDTEGRFFLVAVVIANDQDNDQLRQALGNIEKLVGKRRARWAHNRFSIRQAYLEQLLQLTELHQGVFYATYQSTTAYIPHTAQTIVRAIRQRAKGSYRAMIEIDGFNEVELAITRRILKAGKVPYHKLRGSRDESVVFLRLADALAGFLRDYYEGQAYTQSLFTEFQNKGIIKKLP